VQQPGPAATSSLLVQALSRLTVELPLVPDEAEVALDDAPEAGHELLGSVAEGVRPAVHHTQHTEDLAVGPQQRNTQVGDQARLRIWGGRPLRVGLGVRDEQHLACIDHLLAILPRQLGPVADCEWVFRLKIRPEDLDQRRLGAHDEGDGNIGELSYGVDDPLPLFDSVVRDRQARPAAAFVHCEHSFVSRDAGQ